MKISKFLLIIRAHLGIILVTVMLTALTSLVISLLEDKTYKATTAVVLNYKGVDPVTGFTLPAGLMPGYMATQIDIIRSRQVALKVIEELKLADDPLVRKDFMEYAKGAGDIRDWLAEGLARKLEVKPSRESGVLNITFKSDNSKMAETGANAFASAYQQIGVQLKEEPLKKASTYFNDQVKVLHSRYVEAQGRYSAYQKQKGIVNPEHRLDVETARLNDLSNQLVGAQSQLMEASARGRGAEGSRANDSPDVMSNPLVQNLRMELARAESKFANTAKRLLPAHPRYESDEAEVNRLRAELNASVRVTSASVSNNAQILARRVADIGAALGAQRAKVLELNEARDALAVLGKEMEAAQRAYEAASQRYTQVNLDGQSNQSDVSILSRAVAPLNPSSPKPLLNLGLAVALGTILGIGFAVLAEMADPRLRSASDLLEVLHAPVLGVFTYSKASSKDSALPRLLSPRHLLAYREQN